MIMFCLIIIMRFLKIYIFDAPISTVFFYSPNYIGFFCFSIIIIIVLKIYTS